MTEKQLSEIVTIGDLIEFQKVILNSIKNLITSHNKKEFYTPKEFSEVTGMKYTTVIHYLNKGNIKASQNGYKKAWLIPYSELERLTNDAYQNTDIYPLTND